MLGNGAVEVHLRQLQKEWGNHIQTSGKYNIFCAP
jgi:hypothetical protein